MKFSENWLRTFVNPSLSGRDLAVAMTMSGIEVEGIESAGSDKSDQIFTIKPTPNRGDCLSVFGVAREVAAITDSTLTPVNIASVPATIADRIEITVESSVACPRYCGRIVRGINGRAVAPVWMVKRLEDSGVRSISAIVDVTNYVMLELGQPLHAFDLACITGGIHVRFGRKNETLKLLNEQQVKFDKDLLVIADQKKPLALAGIMGGAEGSVEAQTTDVFIESAFFDPLTIAGRLRVLGFSSDSSYRFERGVDFAATIRAIEYATKLILEICGGSAGPVCEASAALPERKPVRLRCARVERVLGVAISELQISDILRRLKFEYQARGDDFIVTPPSYRFDLAIEEDLIEEVARIYGYDKIPPSQPSGIAKMLPVTETRSSVNMLRSLMVARDYQEVVTYSFVDRHWEEEFCSNNNPVALLNPIAGHMNVMRSSLIASLVDCLKLNISRQHDRVRLFEIAHCFEHGATEYRQTTRLAALAYGEVVPEQWGTPKRQVDFYDIKSDLETLLVPDIAHFKSARHPALHPGRSAEVSISGVSAGWLGELHPRLQQKYDLPFAPVIFELNLDARINSQLIVCKEISRLPVVRRDISFTVAADVAWGSILIALKKSAPGEVLEITPFDIYRGKGIDSDKKSVAFRVLLQDTLKTLTDAQVNTVVEHFHKVLREQFNAIVRK
jgi:phenylalanyl-tRNA synthetase beta chain